MKLSVNGARSLILGAGLLVAGAPAALAQTVFDGNILWENYQNGVLCNIERTTAQPAGFTSLQLYNQFAHNDSLNPMLADPYSKTNPNWVPANNSPASGRIDDVVEMVVHERECDNCPDFPAWAKMEKVCFRGAIPPADLGSDWTQGWTYYNDTGAGRTDIDYSKPLMIWDTDINAHVTWFNTNNYLIRGRINVNDYASLYIEPGTVIFGESGTVPFLCIQMGGKIFAIGTKEQPIVLTSDQAPGSMAAGDIAGLVLNGRAIANCADCRNGQVCLTEGTTTYHCGNDDCDSSGELRYFRSEYAGYVLSPNNELNSITFCSVGKNTKVEYLEAFRGKDDLFEWFGGAVTCKYLVGVGGGDDCLDTQMGYRGNVQFFVAQQWGDNGSDKGIEWDNNEFNYDASCRNNPCIANCTFINVDHGTGTSTWGAHLRRGTDAQIYNSIFMGWKKPGLYVQDNATAARGFYPQPPVGCSVASVDPTEVVSNEFQVRALNPVHGQAMFFVNVVQSGTTKLRVYDTKGSLVHSAEANLGAGAQTLAWNPAGENAANGTYFYRVENGGRTATGKVVIVR